jgi:hypothetical protein
MTRRWLAAAVAVSITLVVGGGFAVADGGGAVAAAYVVVALALLVLVAIRVGPAEGPRRTAGRRPRATDTTGAFPSYRKIVSALIWSGTARRHYDRTTRPVLQRIAAALLAERHHVDPGTNPDAARVLLGERAWPLLDPARAPDDRDGTPGVGAKDLEHLVERLERL